MQNTNQSEPTSKIPWRKTPEGKAWKREYDKAYSQTPEAIAKRRAREQTLEFKAKQKAYSQTPEAIAKRRAREQTLEFKAKQKDRRQTLEVKAKRKSYKQTPEYKAKQKAYKQTPEYKAKQKAYLAEWFKANKEGVYARRKQRHKENPLSKAADLLRAVVYKSFSRIGENKPANTQTLLGCDWKEAKAHIESLFKEGMSWENHGEWHVDHIVPVDYFVKVLKNLDSMNLISNLQPLWADENLKKSDKIH